MTVQDVGARVIVRLGVCAALVVAIAIGYAAVLDFPFVELDDTLYVTDNEMIRRGWTWDGVVWAFTTPIHGNWHPITWLSHMLDCEWFGLDPAGHHATSVVLHAVNACVFFLLLARLTGSVACSAFAALLFALHPLRVESVAWIAERKDVLSAMFALLCIGAYARFGRTGSRRAYAGALALFALGLLSKPTLVALPVGLLLLDRWPLGRLDAANLRVRVMEKLPFLGLAAIVAGITLVAHASSVHDPPLALQVANVLRAYGSYLSMVFWPVDLAVLYPYPLHVEVGPALLSGGVLIAVTGIASWQLRARPWLLTGWLWFGLLLLPVSGVVPVGFQGWADRYTYLASLGLCWAVVWTARDLLSWLPARRVIAAGLAGVVLVGGLSLTRTQVWHWRSHAALFERALAVTERNFFAHTEVGIGRMRDQRYADALAHFTEATGMQPGYARARANRGWALLELDRPADAAAEIERALEIEPGLALAYYYLGRAYEAGGRDADAVRAYREQLRQRADHAPSRQRLEKLL